MKFRLFDTYVIDQADDQVSWIRIFPKDLRLMTGRGVYRDDVLILLFPLDITGIADLDDLLESIDLDSLPIWNKTRYLVHMGNANQGYPVQEAVEVESGRHLERDEIMELVGRIEEVF